MANGYGALTLADMLRQGVPQDALRARQEGLVDALRTAPARRPPKPFPRELFDQPPESIPEQYLTDPLFAGAYNTYRGTQPTPSTSAAELLGTAPKPRASRPWFADMPLEQIPEEMLTDPDFAAAYNAWQGTEATPGDAEETAEAPELEASEDETTEDAPLMVQGGPQENRAPGVYPVAGEPGMVDVVLEGGAGGRMSEDEFYGSPGLTAAVRKAMAPQREAASMAAMPVAAGESEAVETAPGETTVYLPPEAQEPAGGVEVAVGEPQIQRRVAAEAPAALMTAEQQKAALEAVRSGREATRAIAEAPVLQREAPAAVANGKGNGAASQVADLVKTAAPAVQQAMADNLITPEGLRLLTVLTRDPTLMRIGEIVAGEAASARQLQSKEALAKQTAADKAAAAKDLAEYRKGMLGAAEKRASAALINARKPPRPSFAQEWRQIQADERDLQKLGKDTEEMAALAPDMQRLLNAAGQKGDIAGAGILGSRAPGFLLDQEGIQNRQAAMRVASALLREVSGAAVTPQEAQRFMEGRGLGPGATEAQFRSGARSLANELAARLRAKQGKYRPELVNVLRSRGGFTADQLPAAKDAATVQTGRIRVRDTKTGRTGWASEGEKLPPGVEVMR